MENNRIKISHLSKIAEVLKERPKRKVVAVNGTDSSSISALRHAVEMEMISAVIIGDKDSFHATCDNLKVEPEIFEFVNARSVDEAVQLSVEMIQNRLADVIMKGLLPTDRFLKVLLKKEYDLVGEKRTLAHLAVASIDTYPRLLLFSDSAIIPYPDLSQKAIITQYLIDTADKLGIVKPNVAVIAPTEQIIPSIPACVDGALLARMSKTGQISGGVVEGPMALDVALSRDAASLKGVESEVAGNADCLLFPNIDSANVFYKTNSKLYGTPMAGIIVGAKVPVVVSSRGDSKETKFYSIALASLLG